MGDSQEAIIHYVQTDMLALDCFFLTFGIQERGISLAYRQSQHSCFPCCRIFCIISKYHSHSFFILSILLL